MKEMRRRLATIVLLLGCVVSATAQQPVRARANVTAYYKESDIEKEGYRESPYYRTLSGSWQQKTTDTSIIYSRQLDVEPSWKDYLVYLSVRCGRGVRVSVDGKEIGQGGDSRHWNEFLLTGLHYGKTSLLTFETMKASREGLLEDSTIQVGLNGEPYLLFKNDPNIFDMSVVADYDAATTSGSLTLSTDVFCGKRKGKYYVEVELWDSKGHTFDRLGRWVVFNGKNEESVELSRTWPNVEPWNAENPVLYTAVVRLRNEKMEKEEVVGFRFGFRRVEVKEGVLQLNGKAITLKGVTYGTEHTEGFSSREQMKRDVLSMKRLNINAVRTSRYSPMDPYFYELCDQYGLYVVCDANLLPYSSQHSVVATDQDYLPLFEHRVDNLYGKYKNYTSIIAWSLGNTRDNGVCMTAVYRRLKAHEKNRPVIFSGADYGESTDIIAPQLPDEKTLRQALGKQGNRPYLMLTSVDAAHFSTLESLWGLVEGYRQLQGGFVDAWPLSTMMQSELKHLFSPFDVKLSKMSVDEGEFVVTNRNDFSSFGQYTLEYNIFTNRQSAITGGDLLVALPPGGSDKVSMRIPQLNMQAGEEAFVRFDLNTRRGAKQQWQTQADLHRGTVMFPLPHKQQHKRMLDNQGSVPDSIDEELLLMPRLFFVGHEQWTMEGIDRMTRRPDNHTLCVDYMMRYVAPSGGVMCDVRSTYTLFGTGDVVVDYTIMPSDRIAGGNLRVGLSVGYAADSVTWYGMDREVCFPSRHSGLIGKYTSPAKGLERGAVRWCALHKGGNDLFMQILDQHCTMSVGEKETKLMPSESSSFRLYMRRYDDRNLLEQLPGQDFPRMMTGIVEPPSIKASEARFSQPLAVVLSSAEKGDIRYTLDGSEPSETSLLYTKPIELITTTVVKARVYVKGQPPSFTATRRFNYDYIVKTSFSRKPNTPYNVGADTLLFDGEKGNLDDLSRGWLGFSGSGVTTVVELAKPLAVETITLRYAHVPVSWVFAPKSVVLSFSSDGVNYTDTMQVAPAFDPVDREQEAPQLVEIKVPVSLQAVKYVKVEPIVVGQIPAWHRAKGLKPWLLMDELEISEAVEKDSE